MIRRGRFGVLMAAVKRTDTHSKGDVVRRFARLQLEGLDRDYSPSGGEFTHRRPPEITEGAPALWGSPR